MKTPSIALAALLLAGIALGGGGCVNREAQKQARETAAVINDPVVQVVAQPAKLGNVQQTVIVTGDVTTAADSQVGPKASGRVTQVLVNDGDRVAAGQALAQMDASVLTAQLAQASAQEFQARAALGQAQSALSQALRNQAINPQKSVAAIGSAQANLRSAQANYAKVKTGARPQERLQAQSTVASAKANLDTQSKQLDRIRNLVQEGAVAGSQLDAQQATYEAARTQYQNAVQSLNLIQQGNRAEDVAAAEEGVRAAQQAVATAKANRSLDALYVDQVSNARAGIAAAQANILAAAAGAAQARQNLADATIRAPFAGTVSGKPVQPGTVVAPGSSILRLVGSQGVYFDGNVPADTINDLRSGQPVTISVDAVPGRTFPGTVKTVGNLGSSVGRLFSARVGFDGVPAEVRPGMFARATIVLRTVRDAATVPSTAILADGTGSYVMLIQNGAAHKARVTPGLVQGDATQVSGLPPGAQVIVKGANNLAEGAKVKAVSA